LGKSELELFITKVKKNFEDAVSFCAGKGGKLYEPRNTNTMIDVSNQAKAKGIGRFWLGIHDKKEEGTFVYVSDDSPIEFKNWNNGEPNDYGNDEDCVAVYGNTNAYRRKWNDLSCQTHESSIVCVREKQGNCYRVLLTIRAS
jgi:hypothetical protein